MLGGAPEIETAWAEMLREKGEYVQSGDVLKAAAATYPQSFWLWFQRVRALIEAGEFAQAERAIAAAPDCSAREQSRILLLRGLLAEAQWRPDEAYRHFLDALRGMPTNPWLSELAAKAALSPPQQRNLRGDTSKSGRGTTRRTAPPNREASGFLRRTLGS